MRKRLELSIGNLFGASIIDLTIVYGVANFSPVTGLDTTKLYSIIGFLGLLSTLVVIPVFVKLPTKILGALFIGAYAALLVWLLASSVI